AEGRFARQRNVRMLRYPERFEPPLLQRTRHVGRPYRIVRGEIGDAEIHLVLPRLVAASTRFFFPRATAPGPPRYRQTATPAIAPPPPTVIARSAPSPSLRGAQRRSNPYVDGPWPSSRAGGFSDRFACIHMSGLSVRSHMTAGQDGFRGGSSRQRRGLFATGLHG